MKYLVLGGSSFYGSSFLNLLKEKGEKAEDYSRPQFDINRDSLKTGPDDVVVNFIAEAAHVADSWNRPLDFLQTNVMGTCRLIEELCHQKLKLFLHVSTPEVHGSNASWIRERRDYLPTTPYAVSRATADMMLRVYYKAYRFPVIITRTANIYGRGQQDFRLIPKAFSTISKGEKFTVDGRGASIRSFIHVKDACEGLYLLTKKGVLGETYHISTDQTHKVREVVSKICTILKKDYAKVVQYKKDRIGKDHSYLLNSDKIRALGWREYINLDEGLREYYESDPAVAERRRSFSVETRKAL